MTRLRNTWGPGASLGLLLLVLIALFSIMRPHDFPTSANAQTIASQESVPALLALAAAVPLLAGEFDVSIGGNLGFVAVFCAWALGHGLPTVPVIIASLLIGGLIGLLNAFLVVRLGLQSFIATLGISTLLEGGDNLVTGGDTLYNGIPHEFQQIAQASVVGIPLIAVYVVVTAGFLWFVLDRTPFGRRLRASGSARQAAELVGVNTGRHVAGSFVIAGVVSGAAGILLCGLNGSAGPDLGTDLLLPAFAAAFLGSTALRRQRFNIWGTILAVLILSVGISGLTMIGAPFWVPYVFNAVALLVALTLARINVARVT